MSTVTPYAEAPLIPEKVTMGDVTETILKPTERMPGIGWWSLFLVAVGMLSVGVLSVAIQMYRGVGVWGINHPIGWAFDITNFVFWVGIGHAGTLISAILFLLRQKWRTSINRSAEAMTIFAVITALMFPLLHTGRPWLAIYWLLPYWPNERLLWVNFRSPLLWDVFAVSTYFTISLCFWFTGLIPDIAAMRERAQGKIRKKILGLLSIGWSGTMRQWVHFEKAYLLFAGLATPLVLSVHTIVSFDFATSIMPGWHTTIFPPYFVAGAIFGGFAMVMVLLVPLRKAFGLEEMITIKHLEFMNKIMLATGMMVSYAYATEFFMAWYSENQYERFVFWNRLTGHYWWTVWLMITCNAIIPQLFWFKKMRTSIPVMFGVAIMINVGMWFERFNIIVTSLAQDFLPSNWAFYEPTIFDFGVTIGSFGLFFTLFLLFIRVLPTLSLAEVKSVLLRPAGDKHRKESTHA
ncbi:MAG: polysulfide reductase NrfD [bacterium]|nr:polysulfide reductase NrfD [bacterium]